MRGLSIAEPTLQIYHQFHKGDAAAFELIVRFHQNSVYGFLCRRGLSKSVCDDLFQEIFVKVGRSHDRYQPGRPFRPWLFTIALNAIRSHARQHPMNKVADAPTEREEDAGQGGNHTYELLAAKETARFLEKSIAELAPAQRDVLQLICGRRMEIAEVAETLDIPHATVKTLLRRGRLILAKKLTLRDQRVARESERSEVL